MKPRVVDDAAALMIGGELLSGKIRDENLFHLARTMRALGIQLTRASFVPDDLQTIAREVRALALEHGVVFTSGGVGPTHDDVTVAAVAEALDRPVVEEPALVQLLEGVYGQDMTDEHRLMARVPEGARLLETDDIRWPTVVADNVWILPGVPELFHMKLAVVRAHLRGPQPFFSVSLFTRLDEVRLKAHLDHVVATHPLVEVGSYPKWFDDRYKTRVTFDARKLEWAKAAANELSDLIGAESIVALD